MAFIQYLNFDGADLPLPTSFDLSMDAVEADTTGETEAGTTQRDVVRQGVVSISVTFAVSAIWLKRLSVYSKKDKLVYVNRITVKNTILMWDNKRLPGK